MCQGRSNCPKIPMQTDRREDVTLFFVVVGLLSQFKLHRCVIEVFGGLFVLSIGFRIRTELDLLLFLSTFKILTFNIVSLVFYILL